MQLNLSVRFTSDPEDVPAFVTLQLDPAETAFLLFDCTYDDPDSGVGRVLEGILAPALNAVRSVGMRLVLTRLIEDHLGYSSTCAELIQACESVPAQTESRKVDSSAAVS